MKTSHPPSHWIVVALVLAAFLLTLTEAHGQATGAAVFEGRPAMAGAQGGQGAQAGMAQGGLGVQGSDDPALRKDIAPARDPGVAKDQRSAVKKAKRGAKRTISRARHGVTPIDSAASATPK